jgi:hypothetical protein
MSLWVTRVIFDAFARCLLIRSQRHKSGHRRMSLKGQGRKQSIDAFFSAAMTPYSGRSALRVASISLALGIFATQPFPQLATDAAADPAAHNQARNAAYRSAAR